MRNLKITFILSLFLSTCAFAQCFQNDKGLLSWEEDNNERYAGAYHFGYSEGESTLRIFVDDDRIWAQIIQGEWSEGATEWLSTYTNLDTISIEGNRISSSRFIGTFMIEDRDSQMVKGLLVENSWSGWCEDGELEFGFFHGAESNSLPGRFPEASLTVLNADDLKDLSPDFLRYMRNEIFARYGYRFKTEIGGWFLQQSWYRPMYDDVTEFLTEVEKENVALIKGLED
ncbi:MAG: YARHG domain-containing protein [Bacteroidia bacterium]